MLEENSMRNFLSLADVADSNRVMIDTIVEDAFCAHISKGIAYHGRTEDCMHAVSYH